MVQYTRLAEGYTLKELILKGQNRHYDSEPCSDVDVTDAEIEQICKNLKEIALKNTWQDSEKSNIKDITKNTLVSWGILLEENGRVLPTSAFAYMKIIEKWGTGIPRMFRECKEYGLPEPKLIDFDGDFRVNMYRKAGSEISGTTQTTQTFSVFLRDAHSFTDDDKAILSLVYDRPTLTQKEYAMELGWTADRVKYYLRKMKTQGIIKRVGSSHNGHWEFL